MSPIRSEGQFRCGRCPSAAGRHPLRGAAADGSVRLCRTGQCHGLPTGRLPNTSVERERRARLIRRAIRLLAGPSSQPRNEWHSLHRGAERMVHSEACQALGRPDRQGRDQAVMRPLPGCAAGRDQRLGLVGLWAINVSSGISGFGRIFASVKCVPKVPARGLARLPHRVRFAGTVARLVLHPVPDWLVVVPARVGSLVPQAQCRFVRTVGPGWVVRTVGPGWVVRTVGPRWVVRTVGRDWARRSHLEPRRTRRRRRR